MAASLEVPPLAKARVGHQDMSLHKNVPHGRLIRVDRET